MKNKCTSVAQKSHKKKIAVSSSSSEDDWMQNHNPRCRGEAYKQLVFDESSRSPIAAGARNPKARSTLKKQMAPTSGKKRGYVVYDEASDDDFQPTIHKKVATLRQGLKISSAAAKKFERDFPWQLKVAATQPTALSKSNKKLKDEEDAVSDNAKLLAMEGIRRHLKKHDQKLDVIKKMLLQMVGRERVRERVHSKIQKSEQGKSAPRSSDCQIVSYTCWSPAAAGNPKNTPPIVCNPKITPGSSGKKRATTLSPGGRVDPHELIDASEFMIWRRLAAAASDSPLSLRLPSEVYTRGDYKWFTELYDDEISFRDEYMDVLINWLVVKFEHERGASSRDWTILEMWSWGGLTQNSTKRCEDDLLPYARGAYPLNHGKAWHTVDRLYGFGHVNNNHWVGFEINLREQRITVIDSMFLGSKRIGGYFEHMARNLPLLCEKIGLWETKGYTEPLRSIWDVIYASDSPRQDDDDKHNCGILVMKALEAMICGNNFDKIKADHCGVYRLRYCVDLHVNSQLLSAAE